MIRERTIAHRMTFVQSVNYKSPYRMISQSLDLASSINSPQSERIQNELFLYQTIRYTNSNWSFSFVHGLDLQSRVYRTRTFHFTDTLNLEQSMPETPAEYFADSLNLEQGIWYSKTTNVLSIVDTLSLTSRFGFILRPPDQPDYRDLVCDFEADSIALISDLDVLILPPPKLSNTNELNFTRVLRRNRGNELIMYADALWPKAERIRYGFETLDETQGKALQRFALRSLGKTIIINDMDGHSYTGIIVTPEIKLIQSGKCIYETEFTFERHP